MLVNTATIWRTTLERLELEHTQIDAVSKAWLQDAHLLTIPHVAADAIDAPLDAQEQGVYFTLQVPNNLARDVITTRWRRSIEEILKELTGQAVTLSVTDERTEGLSSVPKPPPSE